MTLEMVKSAHAISEINVPIQKTKTGMKRRLIQIQKTVGFELKKNQSKFIAMLIISLGIYVLFLIINLIQEGKGAPLPADPIDYINTYFIMISFLIMIIAVTMGGGIIAEDFEKETGNLLFPKIQKNRLLAGRVIARYIYAAISVALFYVLIGITTLIKYDTLPAILWESMGWSLLYTFAVFSFIILFSSFMKRTATAMIVGMVFVLMVFELLSLILMFTGVTIEPFFMLNYYAKIITACFNMPAE
jgi:ABC-type transport system involved in multi-copper enzyme maturation permease subunit